MVCRDRAPLARHRFRPAGSRQVPRDGAALVLEHAINDAARARASHWTSAATYAGARERAGLVAVSGRTPTCG
jgi:hypothetical protein